MKKLALTTVCAFAMAGAVFAQGTVNWLTIGAAGYTAQTNSTVYSPLFGGGSSGGGSIGNTANTGLSGTYGTSGTYDWEILYLGGASVSAPSTLSSLLTWKDAGIGAVSTAAAFGRVQPVGPTTAATVPWATGTTDNIVLVGWSVNLGSSWLTVSNVLANWASLGIANAYFGISAAGYETPGSADPGSTFIGGGVSATGTPIQSLLTPLYLLPPVPEPGTLALAGLGGLSLLLFRRQRK